MRKIIKAGLCHVMLTAFLFLLIPLGGCHGSAGLPEFRIPEAFDTSRSFELSFWAKNDTNRSQVNIYKKAISDFESIYPNIKVNLRLYTDYGKIYNDVITNISTGTTPNICITYPDHIASYITGSNVVAPLEGLMDDPRYGLGGAEVRFDAPKRSELVEKFMDECVVSGTQYGVPFMRSTEACYINKTMVESMGYRIPESLTWDFIWEVSDAAMEKDENGLFKVNGQNVMIPFMYKSTDNMMIQMLKQKGAGYSDSEGNILLFNDDTKELLCSIVPHVVNGAFSTFKTTGYPGNFLNAGQCIFAIDSTAGATWMGSGAGHQDIAEERIVDFETVVMPIPQFDSENPQMISQGPSICVFNKSDAQEVLASWLFTQYLLTNDVQIAYSQTEGYIPVTKKAIESDEYRDYLTRAGEDSELYYRVKIDAVRMLLDNIDNTFITPVWNGSTSLRDAAGNLIESTVKSVRRKETVNDAYFEKLYSDTASLYRLGQNRADTVSGKKELGALPGTAVTLLAALAAAWIVIGAYAAIRAARERRR